jgi:tetratricopeptide (TPR) repeat protein
MSRVFLAEETALGRRVVLKVPLPAFASAISGDRFQREVRIAAALQHPHIVPLLASGQAAELVYYTMPFVEGESLRARLARERELPIADAISVLRDVADALAYAHRRGIVHRDIKPDNILLTHHHAVVADFGIAKALVEAGGADAATGTGVSIGTPGYMAPEQATADPQIDHRADLFALGVVGYEMLAGEPPFRGANSQAVVGTLLTATPMPLQAVRPAVPPRLAAIIHRCLEKRPADRWQTAEELTQALATLSEDVRPAQPERAATGRLALTTIAVWFGLASLGVTAVAWSLQSLLGLPDWVVPAAVVLLGLGLPVVLLAATAHNRRLEDRPPSGMPLLVARRLTLRGAIWGGVLAFAVLGLTSAGYMIMRAVGIGPYGTLVASGRLQERERILIADFTDRTRDGLLGAAATQAFRIDLGQSKLVSVVEPTYVRQILRRMGRPDSIPLEPAVAREAAQRGGFKAVIAGELQQVGPSYLISAELISADSGTILASGRETARDSTEILDAVDRISKRIRERIGESLRGLRSNPPLADVTTPSLDALRKYSAAIRFDGIDEQRTIELLEDAVAADSTFAMAWRKLGTVLANNQERAARATKALTRAFQHRDRLTFRERKLTENSYYMDVAGALDSAEASLQSLLAEHPNDSWALNNLGVLYELNGSVARAAEAIAKAARLEPENYLSWSNLHGTQLGLGQFDSAAATLELIRQRFPLNPQVDELSLMAPLTLGDFAGAERGIREQLERYRHEPRAQLRLQRLLAAALTLQGKLAEADRAFLASAELFAARGFKARALEQRARRALPLAIYLGDTLAAVSRLGEALRAIPLESLVEPDRPLRWLIHVAAAIGDRTRANQWLAEFTRHPGELPGRARKMALNLTRGEVLANEGATLSEATAAFHRARLGPAGHLINIEMANAFDRGAMPDSAIHYYQRWANGYDRGWPNGIYQVWTPKAYYRLAELYEARGDRAKAADFYGRFTELWREADPVLQPQVREARRRLAKLLAEPAP